MTDQWEKDSELLRESIDQVIADYTPLLKHAGVKKPFKNCTTMKKKVDMMMTYVRNRDLSKDRRNILFEKAMYFHQQIADLYE